MSTFCVLCTSIVSTYYLQLLRFRKRGATAESQLIGTTGRLHLIIQLHVEVTSTLLLQILAKQLHVEVTTTLLLYHQQVRILTKQLHVQVTTTLLLHHHQVLTEQLHVEVTTTLLLYHQQILTKLMKVIAVRLECVIRPPEKNNNHLTLIIVAGLVAHLL